jgi:hypothetical protein
MQYVGLYTISSQNARQTNIHAPGEIRTHDLSTRAIGIGF